jgi:hypothetical protein
MGRCCRLIRGPPERPALAVEIPADVNSGCAFAKGCCLGSPEWNGLARFASAAGCRRRLPYLRHGPTGLLVSICECYLGVVSPGLLAAAPDIGAS